MSFPRVIANKFYALVEVRASENLIDYNAMQIVYSGPLNAGEYIDSYEGWRLSVRRCNTPENPTSGLGAIYSVEGWNGIKVGEPEKMEF